MEVCGARHGGREITLSVGLRSPLLYCTSLSLQAAVWRHGCLDTVRCIAPHDWLCARCCWGEGSSAMLCETDLVCCRAGLQYCSVILVKSDGNFIATPLWTLSEICTCWLGLDLPQKRLIDRG